jgi:hypothetical protein
MDGLRKKPHSINTIPDARINIVGLFLNKLTLFISNNIIKIINANKNYNLSRIECTGHH